MTEDLIVTCRNIWDGAVNFGDGYNFPDDTQEFGIYRRVPEFEPEQES